MAETQKHTTQKHKANIHALSCIRTHDPTVGVVNTHTIPRGHSDLLAQSSSFHTVLRQYNFYSHPN